jgi:peptidoglycan hydrolase CwlO-like protein
MKPKIKKEKLIAATVVALLVISMAGMVIYHQSNKTLKSGLKDEKLKSETLLSEKLAFAKEVEKLKTDIQAWMGKSHSADRMLEEANTRIGGMEKTIAGLRKENTALASLRKDLNELRQIRADLENQLAALDQSNKNNLKQLDEFRAELASVKAERDDLKFNQKAKAENLTDDFRLETTRGKKKQKLTVNAARTKKLVVSFEIPESMTGDVNFSIITPEGKTIKSNDPRLKSALIEDNRNLTASLSPVSGEFEISRRIEMTYTPDSKLEPGIYKIQILQKDKKVGSAQLRLK